jgi:hypothetical protein
MPGEVKIPEKGTEASFELMTVAASETTPLVITASLGADSQRATLTLQGPSVRLVELKLKSNAVVGGSDSECTVVLSGPAPPGGIEVTLASIGEKNVVKVPQRLTLEEGTREKAFSIKTEKVPNDTTVTITGSYRDGKPTARLTVQAPVVGVASLTLRPNSVTGGMSSAATVTLDGPAPPGGAVVRLRIEDKQGVARLPPTVTVPAGQTSARVDIHTTAVKMASDITVRASYSRTEKSATLTVLPPRRPSK